MRYLIVLLAMILVSASASAETFCKYDGPDISDGLNLTSFTVEGPDDIEPGQLITIKFNLKNSLNTPISTDDLGVFAGLRLKYSDNITLGESYRNKVISPGQSVSFSETYNVMDKGVIQIWPSYEIEVGYDSKIGPELWHACKIEVCPDYCADGKARHFLETDENGICKYTKETCEFGCNNDNTACSTDVRLEFVEEATYTFTRNAEAEDCFPYLTMSWSTNREVDSTISFRKFGENSWKTVTAYQTLEGNEYVQKHNPIAFEANATYFIRAKSCSKLGCIETQDFNVSTPNFMKLDKIRTSSGFISWNTICQDNVIPAISLYPTNYTIHIIMSYQKELPNAPWETYTNSTFSEQHKEPFQLDDYKDYTFYMNYCDKFGMCARSHKYSFKAVPEPQDLNAFAEPFCGDNLCDTGESFNSCPKDCQSGSADSYCDKIADNKCDPDCKFGDPDCKSYLRTWILGGVVLAALVLGYLYYRKKNKIFIEIKHRHHDPIEHEQKP